MCFVLTVAFLLLPLVMLPGIEDFILLPKLLMLQVLLVGLLGSALLTRKLRILALATHDWLLIAFFLILAASTFWAVNPYRSTYDLAKHLTFLFFYLLIANNVGHTYLWPALTAHAAAGAFISCVGLLEYHEILPFAIPSTGRPSAFFGYRNLAAAYLACATPLAATLIVAGKGPPHRLLGAVATSLMVVFLAYTRARASWVGLTVGLGAALALWALSVGPARALTWLRETTRRDRFRPAAAVVLIVLGLAFLPESFRETHIQRFDERKTDFTTTVISIFKPGGDRGRLQMWRSTLDMIADAPVLGVGLGNWAYFFPRYDRTNLVQPQYNPLRPHNDLIWIWSEVGTFGLACFLGFLVATARAAWRRWRRDPTRDTLVQALLLATVISYVAVGQFTFPWERPSTSFLFWFALGCLSAADRARGRPKYVPGGTTPGLLLAALCLAITIDRILSDYHFLHARLAFQRKDYGALLARTDRALDYGPYEHQAHLLRGEALLKLGRVEEAEDAYRRVLDYHPHFANAYNGLGYVAYTQGNLTEAARLYEKAIDLVPKHLHAIYNLGIVRQDQGRKDEAADLYLRSFEDNHAKPYVNLGNILVEKGLRDSARAVWRSAANAANDPVHAAWINIANLNLEDRKFDAAIEAFNTFMRRETDTTYATVASQGLAAAYAEKGLDAEQAGQISEAFDAYETSTRIEPASAQSWYNLGNIYKRIGDTQKAIDVYTRAVNLDTGYVDALNNLGLIYADAGAFEEATATYRRALQQDPSNAIVHYNLGNVQLGKGQVDSALASYDRFERSWSGDPALRHYYMSVIHLVIGDTARAVTALRTFLKDWRGDEGKRERARSTLTSIGGNRP